MKINCKGNYEYCYWGACFLRIAAMLFAFLYSTGINAQYYENYPPDNTKVKINRTNLPIVFIDTKCGDDYPQTIERYYRIAARMKIISNADGINYGDTIAHPNQQVDYEGWIGIKYRGNSSFNSSDKKPYSIKTLLTEDVDGEKQKVKIMGMPKDNDWVMLAPFADRSMIRDVLMFQLARPYFEYTPQARHCELILDGVYYGVYVMAERVRRGKHRLNLDKPGDDGDELTGGYHLEIDRNDEDQVYTSKYHTRDEEGNEYWNNNNDYFQYKYPEYDDMVPEHEAQLEYIQRQIDKMEDALAADNFADPDNGYRKYIDELSFIDQQLSQEVSGNIDGYRLSTSIYKHRDSVDPRFKTALWDFNIAFGNADYYGGERTDFWIYKNTYIDYNDNTKVPFWWARLMEDHNYANMLKSRWAQYRQENFSDEHIEATIDSLVNMLNAEGAQQRNYSAWQRWGEYIWPVPNWWSIDTYEKEINNLRQWLSERIAWMDKQLAYDPADVIVVPREEETELAAIYNAQGQQIPKLKKGLNIIKYKDGHTRKIFLK